MKLFDGSDNYELNGFCVREDQNKTPIVYLYLDKNTNVQVGFDATEKCVVNKGKEYNIAGVHDTKIDLWFKSLGNFKIHAKSEIETQRLHRLSDMLHDYVGKANVYIEVNLIGDNNKDEVGLHEFALKTTAGPKQWAFTFEKY